MCESKLGSLEKTMNQKALDLQKREQKLFFVEEELKTKVSEASKQISKKDDEIIQLKKKFKEEKQQMEQEKQQVQQKLDDQLKSYG